MIGIIGIDELEVSCIIGAHEFERGSQQKLLIDLKMHADFSKAVETDQLKDTINYDKAASLIEEAARLGGFKLLEALALEIINRIQEHFAVKKVWVRIMKPSAIKKAKQAFVEFEWEESKI